MTANRATLYFIGYTIVFVWFFGVALDGLESMRYMWLVWSFNLVLAAVAITALARRIRGRVAKEQSRVRRENAQDSKGKC